MKNKRLSGMSVKYIINMLSLLIFIVSYQYIYRDYVKKTENTYAQIGLLKQKIINIEERIAAKDETIIKTEEITADNLKVIERYPANIFKVDNLLFVDQMEKALKMELRLIDSTNAAIFYDTGLPAKSSTDEKTSGNITGLEAKLTLNYETDYKGLKRMIDYILKYPQHTTIESLTVNRDDTIGSLTGSIVLRRYALAGTGKEYIKPVVDGIKLGTGNIFGQYEND